MACDPEVGSFDDEGYFHAVSTPAVGNLYATYNGITTTQPVTIMEAQWQLVSDSVVIDRFHPYAININGISGYGLDKVDPSVVAWASSDENVCSVDGNGVITAVADGQTFVGSSHPLLADSLLVRVENPKARVTTVENAPIEPGTWSIAQSGGKDRVVTAMDNGMKIDFTGASSRNPYIKISKAVQMWGVPDTLRLRMRPGNLQLKLVKIMIESAFGERVTAECPIEGVVGDEITVNVPVSDVCDAGDMGSYPLHLVYYYITYSTVNVGEQYSLEIPGMELVYASMPPDVQPATPDVNLDGEVNIADVNALIDMVLSGRVASLGDVNGDGEVNIADVNALIALILS